MAQDFSAETVDLLQTLIRNGCVNDGSPDSGNESRNAEVLRAYLEPTGIAIETYEARPGRSTLVARIEGTDPSAPSLCLDGHTDVVPVNPDGWDRDPFGGEVVDGEVWGRGAVDMLNLTASMAVAVGHLATEGFRPAGDLVFLAVADEEAGSEWGADWMRLNHPEEITTTYALTENGGLHGGSEASPVVGMNVGEKGIAWRRLTVRGTPGHGSMPFGADNALIKAAGVVQRIADYRPPARFHEYWRGQVEALIPEGEMRDILLDPSRIDSALDDLPVPAARFLHACTHTTFSPNVANSQTKTNVIPDTVSIDVDIRTLPGETADDVAAHLAEALGDDLAAHVEIDEVLNHPSSHSAADTPLWDAMQTAVHNSFPASRLVPQLTVGFTDARVHRELGAVAYGAGLLSPSLSSGEFASRFHGNNERIDVESLSLTTRFYLDTVRELLS